MYRTAAALLFILQGVSGDVQGPTSEALPSVCGDDVTTPISVQAASTLNQACEWTGDCQVPGCTEKCIVSDTTGEMFAYLEDTVYSQGNDTWKLCPDLALVVMEYLKVVREHPDRTVDPSFAPSTLLSDDFKYDNLTCPTAALVREAAPAMQEEAAFIQNQLDRLEAGQTPTDEYGAAYLKAPVRAMALIPFFQSSDMLIEFMAEHCATRFLELDLLTELHLGYYMGQGWHNHIESGSTFQLCMDNLFGYEIYQRNWVYTLQECLPPFRELPDCLTFKITHFYWPNTEACADYLATIHNADPDLVKQVVPVIEDARNECSNQTTQQQCEAVPFNPYGERVKAIVGRGSSFSSTVDETVINATDTDTTSSPDDATTPEPSTASARGFDAEPSAEEEDGAANVDVIQLAGSHAAVNPIRRSIWQVLVAFLVSVGTLSEALFSTLPC